MIKYKKTLANLPKNVQDAILLAHNKKKHSDFFYRLRDVNNKVQIFTHLFYGKVQFHEKIW